MTILRTLAAPLAFSALIAGAVPVLAQQPGSALITANDVDRIMNLARAYGTVERREDDLGVWIRGDIDGTIYSISFLNCNDDNRNCDTLQFRAWWESEGRHTMEAMNTWNRERRFSSAYLSDDNNATVEWDVNLEGGVTEANFDSSMQWWQLVLRRFREEVIDGNAPDAAPAAPNAGK